MTPRLLWGGPFLDERIREADRPTSLRRWLIDVPAQSVLAGAAAVAPWLFGGVQARVQVWLFAAVLVPLVLWLFARARRNPARLPLAVVPLAGAVALAGVQLIPVGEFARGVFSPGGEQFRRVMLPAPSSPEQWEVRLGEADASSRRPLSLYPASTRRDLGLLLFATAAFVGGAAFFAGPASQIGLCSVVAVNGALLATFGIVQQSSWNGLLYWSVPLTRGGAPFGPFVCRNHAGGFLNLCLAGAVGASIWVVGQCRSRRSDHGEAGSGRWLQPIADLNVATLAVLAATGCIVAGILCSLSRTAGGALLGATVVTVFAARRARRGRIGLWPLVVAVLGGVLLAGWAGMAGSIHDRFGSLFAQRSFLESRMPHWRDGFKAVPDFWPLGSGLGTYAYVYPPYQDRLDRAWYRHAENQYLEALVDGGVVGLALMLAMIALVGLAAWRLVRDDDDPRSVAFGAACLFALSGQAVHACFDFALYLPACVLLLALLAGAACGRAACLARRTRASGLFVLSRVPGLTPVLVLLLLAGGIWGVCETRSLAAVDRALAADRLLESSQDDLTPERIVGAIERLDAAVRRREDDVHAQQRLAELWVLLYRKRAFDALRRETLAETSDSQLWQMTSPWVFHGRAHDLAAAGRWSELDQLRAEPVVRDHLTPALRHLARARAACPMVPEVHAAIAELCPLLASPAEGAVHVDRARRLAPSDPDMLFRCGLLDLQARRFDAACASWRRSLALSRDRLDDVVRLAQIAFGPSQWIERVLPESPWLLVDLARRRYASEEDGEVRRVLAERVRTLAGQADVPEGERHFFDGAALALLGRDSEAIEQMARAVRTRPGNPEWRYELALLLERQGRYGEAREQARVCVRLDRASGRYRTLLERVDRGPD